ncbi:glycoside hydrolase family 43 protein [Sphingomonas radiodurans]|uniref:glycoside hydrolase family 43 protein n=1 Tax=Sphingomonas radiodurans TaxID=2890321 RepID=UPI001E2A8107|nr:glycoside hydrolase family 43 protein [Sphingomonas radiodurans]WBH15530.1 glycoside hydrolase family 43 protein [Sphingomonas radiodurans]
MKFARTLAALSGAVTLLGAAEPRRDAPARFDWFDYQGADPVHQRPAPKADEYANPIMAGFYPDPHTIRVGEYFYLVTSTFSYFPGLPIHRSRDLVNWTQIGNAIDRPGQLNFDGIGLSRGVFAPALNHHAGVFYLVNTCVDCGGNYVLTAKDPAGPWSDPVWIKDVGGIDPSLFIEADGSAWLLNNDAPEGKPLYEGHRAIWIRRFDLKTLRTTGPATMIVNGGVDITKKPIWAEGPHIFRHEGKYYLITAEGGTAVDHSEVVYRGDRPEGPWTAYPRPILTQRDLPADRPNPITSAGHAALFTTPKGDWWATFLAVRPYAGDLYNTGRETFLLPVRWKDGWPIITEPGQSIPYIHRRPDLPRAPTAAVPTNGVFGVREEFATPALAPYWLMVRAPKSRWYRFADGALEITPRAERIGEPLQPSFIARRQQHMNAAASTQVSFDAGTPGAKAGLVVYQDDAHYYFVGVVNEGGRRLIRVERRASATDPKDGVVLASAPLSSTKPIRLRITARGASYDFHYGTGATGWTPLLTNADGKLLSTQVAGGFVGATMGMYAYAPAAGS